MTFGRQCGAGGVAAPVTHPHPGLPLEGEGVLGSLASVAPCICSLPLKLVFTLTLLPFKGRTEVGMGEAARALPGEAVNAVNVVNVVKAGLL